MAWSKTYHLANRGWFPLIFLVLALGLLAAAWILAAPVGFEHIASALGVAGGFTGFLYAQHAEQTRLFAKLFRAFNERYDKLNTNLNLIIARPQDEKELSEREKQDLFDYFNLCAEEFLYYDAGYIDEHVWASWKNGMRYFAQNSRVRRLWEAELTSGSYYGFEFPLDD